MALATKCPHCNTTFRVASDQLKLRGGIVRCGTCQQVFDGNAALVDLERQGREAMERLIALMRHEEPPAADPRSLHRLLPRESVGVAPTRRPRLRAVPRS